MEEVQNDDVSVKKDFLLPISIITAGVMISGSIIYLVGSKNGPTAQSPESGDDLAAVGSAAPEVSTRDVILGDTDAPVTLIEYGDYQCPFCARFYSQVEGRLREEYIKTGKVRMVFRNFQFLGPESVAAAEAAECAKDQEKFWAFHDAIYEEELVDGREHNGNLNRNLFLGIAGDLGLDAREFTACVDSGKYSNQIEKDRNDAAAVGANSTPTVFINDKVIRGALPYADFRVVIEGELQKSD